MLFLNSSCTVSLTTFFKVSMRLEFDLIVLFVLADLSDLSGRFICEDEAETSQLSLNPLELQQQNFLQNFVAHNLEVASVHRNCSSKIPFTFLSLDSKSGFCYINFFQSFVAPNLAVHDDHLCCSRKTFFKILWLTIRCIVIRSIMTICKGAAETSQPSLVRSTGGAATKLFSKFCCMQSLAS